MSRTRHALALYRGNVHVTAGALGITDRTAATRLGGGRTTGLSLRLLLIDDSKVLSAYANFCRVTGSPEELTIDFGLNPQPFGVPAEPNPVTHRIITNFYTANRMWHALTLTIQRHEATFGVLETDAQKRVQPGVMTRPAGGSCEPGQAIR